MVDIELSLYKYLLKLKEEVKKEYNKEECSANHVYIFDNMDEFRNYFISNGVVDIDDDILGLCKIKTSKKGRIVAFKGLCDHYITGYFQNKKEDRIRKDYSCKIVPYELEKSLDRKFSYEIKNNLIPFYPPNEVVATEPMFFCKDGNNVLNNDSAFRNITNLDEILLKMISIYDKSLDTGDIIDPYCFMLELKDKIKSDYIGRADLVITDKTIVDDVEDKDSARKYYINKFLDHFMGFNFGVIINNNSEVRDALHKLNDRVIDSNMREYAGKGVGVLGTDKFSVNGVLHYYLPVEKNKHK